MPVQMPYSLLGEDNADDPDHTKYGGFLARMEPDTAQPSALTHLRWLGLGILIGCTGLTIYQIGFVGDDPAPVPITSQSTTSSSGQPAINTGASSSMRDGGAQGSYTAGDEPAATRPSRSAVIKQGSAGGPAFADSMDMLPPSGASGSGGPTADMLSGASNSATTSDDQRTIGNDYPTALLAGSLQLSEPSMQNGNTRKASKMSDDDPDVAILQLLLQRIDKKE